MKKWMLLAMSLALAASLCGCGNQASTPAASSSIEGAREEMGETLAGQSATPDSGETSQAQTPEVSDEQGNPIDQFYAPLMNQADTTLAMNGVSVAWRDAWKAELEALAQQKTAQLTYDEDRAKVADFVTATENQAETITALKELTYSDYGVAPAERTGAIGTGYSSDAAMAQVALYRVAFQQLTYTLADEGADSYSYTFDAAAAQAALNG